MRYRQIVETQIAVSCQNSTYCLHNVLLKFKKKKIDLISKIGKCKWFSLQWFKSIFNPFKPNGISNQLEHSISV